MATYRRFCCNDLLQFGPLNLKFGTETHPVRIYLYYMAMWPGNCLVADAPGGRLMGYAFGDLEGMDVNRTGQVAIMALPSTKLSDFSIRLSKLLEDCCDMYGAYTMKTILPADNVTSRYVLDKLGYKIYRQTSESLEMRKPLPRLMATIAGEETQKESIKPPT